METSTVFVVDYFCLEADQGRLDDKSGFNHQAADYFREGIVSDETLEVDWKHELIVTWGCRFENEMKGVNRFWLNFKFMHEGLVNSVVDDFFFNPSSFSIGC